MILDCSFGETKTHPNRKLFLALRITERVSSGGENSPFLCRGFSFASATLDFDFLIAFLEFSIVDFPNFFFNIFSSDVNHHAHSHVCEFRRKQFDLRLDGKFSKFKNEYQNIVFLPEFLVRDINDYCVSRGIPSLAQGAFISLFLYLKFYPLTLRNDRIAS